MNKTPNKRTIQFSYSISSPLKYWYTLMVLSILEWKITDMRNANFDATIPILEWIYKDYITKKWKIKSFFPILSKVYKDFRIKIQKKKKWSKCEMGEFLSTQINCSELRVYWSSWRSWCQRFLRLFYRNYVSLITLEIYVCIKKWHLEANEKCSLFYNSQNIYL